MIRKITNKSTSLKTFDTLTMDREPSNYASPNQCSVSAWMLEFLYFWCRFVFLFGSGLWIPKLKSGSPVPPNVIFLPIRFGFKDLVLKDGRILLSNPTRSANLHTPTHPNPDTKGDPDSNSKPRTLFIVRIVRIIKKMKKKL